MQIDEQIYGSVDISEEVIKELIESTPMQRLKKINQSGASQYILPNRKISRYDHSVGAMVLLRDLGASVEEQVAGLLHDISHTAFSHVVDFVYSSEEHDFHDKHVREVLEDSEIPMILVDHDLDIDRILDMNNFTLLEQNIPDLCADRVDYMLRDMTNYLDMGKRARSHLKHIVIHNNQMIMENFDSALAIAKDFLMIDKQIWGNAREAAAYQILAEALKRAMKKGFLIEKDLFTDDETVWNKLQKMDDDKIQGWLGMLNHKFDVKINDDYYDYECFPKLRYIDPLYISKEGEIHRLSEVNSEYRIILDKYRKSKKGGVHIEITTW